MAKDKQFYITTAIDYVNAAPHIGHAYEKILADVVARWHRLLGENVLYVTGTDENAQKNAQAAKKAKMPVKKFVDKNSKAFIELCKKYGISNDDFIRTTEARHVKKAQEVFQKVYEKGEIYKDKYEGYYCEGCEAFITEKELIDGKCPEHNKKPKWISEDAYFFKLSKYKDKILSLLKKGLIIPQSKANEIISRLEENELRDLCVSRTNLDWGIDFPIDKEYKIYVWFDALVNYLSAAGKKEEFWPADCHAIGKGINWFHSVIWPAMLLSAGYKMPKKVWVHGYLTVNGQKMSKSLGNVVNPLDLLKKYPADAIRYFLLREVPVGYDGDFSEKILKERYNNELANKLGNLVSRVSGIANKGEGKVEAVKVDVVLVDKLNLPLIKSNMENYKPDKALHEIFNFVVACNEYVQQKQPWSLEGNERNQVLYSLVDAIRVAAILLYPFIPSSVEKINKQFGFPKPIIENCKFGLTKSGKIKKGGILFAKIE